MAAKSDDPIYFNRLLKLSETELAARLAAGPEAAARIAYAAATGGSPIAQVVYGQMLLDGHGVERDAAAAFRWFRIAASSGDLDGINMLGRCYENGWGVAPDREQATEWFRRAAAKSHAWAQFNLGMMLMHDGATPGEAATALTLFVRAARQGNAKAMNMIGRFRECGWTGRVDMASAHALVSSRCHGGMFPGGGSSRAHFCASRAASMTPSGWYHRSIAVRAGAILS